MNLLPWIRSLLLPAIFLPLLLAVLFGVLGVLTWLGDTAGARVVGYIGLAGVALWLVSLATLTIATALHLLRKEDL